jgi:hypothetical protein
MNLRRYIIISSLLALLLFAGTATHAQCTMCKANIEQARKEGHSIVGSTLNNGIMYLLVLPYAIAGIFGFIYYRKHKEKQQADRLKKQA